MCILTLFGFWFHNRQTFKYEKGNSREGTDAHTVCLLIYFQWKWCQSLIMHEKCPKKWGHGRPASALYIEDRSGIRTCPGTVLLGGKNGVVMVFQIYTEIAGFLSQNHLCYVLKTKTIRHQLLFGWFKVVNTSNEPMQERTLFRKIWENHWVQEITLCKLI